jgi:hypothetical protein
MTSFGLWRDVIVRALISPRFPDGSLIVAAKLNDIDPHVGLAHVLANQHRWPSPPRAG